MPLTLYFIPDGPPSLAVLQCLNYLNVDHKLVKVDMGTSEYLTEDFAKLNPQKEIPVLDAHGFYLGESNAILQYLADKYAKDETLYPQDVRKRAVVNHRLCFNLSTCLPKQVLWNWYVTYKKEHSKLWGIVETGMKQLILFVKNPPK